MGPYTNSFHPFLFLLFYLLLSNLSISISVYANACEKTKKELKKESNQWKLYSTFAEEEDIIKNGAMEWIEINIRAHQPYNNNNISNKSNNINIFMILLRENENRHTQKKKITKQNKTEWNKTKGKWRWERYKFIHNLLHRNTHTHTKAQIKKKSRTPKKKEQKWKFIRFKRSAKL